LDIPKFISNLTLRQLGTHLVQYTELFTHPYRSWKKVYSQRKTGLDFIVINLIYYFLLLFVILQNFRLAILLVLLEALVTIVPIGIFGVPFLVSTKLFKIRKSWKKLFRVLLLIKLQAAPIIIICALIIKWTDSESIYLIIENLIWLIIMGFIVIVPLINFISIYKKLIWIALNYIFFLIYMLLAGYGFTYFDPEFKLGSKIQLTTPSSEYLNYSIESSSTFHRINFDSYVATYKFLDQDSGRLKSVQFANINLLLLISQNSMNENIRRIKIIDTKLAAIDSNHISHSRDSIIDVVPITQKLLDSIKLNTNNHIYNDLQLYKTAKDSCLYKSNKEYYKMCFENLAHYDSLFADSKITSSILRKVKPLSTAKFAENEIILYYKLPEKYLYRKTNLLLELEEQLENREKKSEYLMNILLYPLVKIEELIYYND
jgi:hypothetical protein